MRLHLEVCKKFTINPLMPKRYFSTSILIIVFKEQMLLSANTYPLVPKAHNSECQNILFPLQIKAKAS